MAIEAGSKHMIALVSHNNTAVSPACVVRFIHNSTYNTHHYLFTRGKYKPGDATTGNQRFMRPLLSTDIILWQQLSRATTITTTDKQ